MHWLNDCRPYPVKVSLAPLEPYLNESEKALTPIYVFHRSFKACNHYAHGEETMAQVHCPVLFVLGEQDQMPTPKAAQLLLAAARKRTELQMVPVGHHQMTEAPEQTLSAMRQFLAST